MCLIYLLVIDLIFFQPGNLNAAIYLIPLISIPFIIFNLISVFNKNYLKYSNLMVKTLINVLGSYIFVCLFLFTAFIIIKVSECEKLTQYLCTFVYFMPILGICVLTIFFWLFLYEGFKKCEQMNVFYFFFLDMLTILSFIITFYFKIIDNLPNFTWINLFTILNIFHGSNFIIIRIYCSLDSSRKKQDFNNNKEDSLYIVFDILINIFLSCIICLVGFYLDNRLDKIKIEALILSINIFFLLILGKNSYKIKKINNFLEWKKLNILK